MILRALPGMWLLCIALAGCDSGLPTTVKGTDKMHNMSTTHCIDHAMGSIKAITAGDSILLSCVKELYITERDFIWIHEGTPTPAALELSQIMQSSFRFGLPPQRYRIPERFKSAKTDFSSNALCDDLANDDVAFSMAAMRFLLNVAIGIQRSNNIKEVRLITDSLVFSALKTIQKGQISTAITSLEPSSPFYHQFRSAIDQFEVFFNHFVIGDIQSNTTENEAVWRLLQTSGFCLFFNPYEKNDFQLALASWQKNNHLIANGQLNFETRKLLHGTAMDQYNKLALNIERIRNFPPNTPVYLWVNIPEFKLYACEDERILETWKVIVGQPKTPTPIITSIMSHVLTYPQWNIPPSIIVGEVLPEMRRDPAYLNRKGYVITNWQGETIDPSQVSVYSYNLNSHPYNIMQPPGADNALGILKFLFDNDNTVYLHDTNGRYLFARNYRALSHGCIRVNEPNRLAAFLLEKNQLSLMDSQLSKKRSGHIKITKNVGICIRYITCRVDEKGNLVMIPDLYHKDAIEQAHLEELN